MRSLFVVLFIAALLGGRALADDRAGADPDLNHFAVGDEYVVQTTRGGRKVEESGVLCTVNKRWILLRRRAETLSPTKLKTVIPGVTRNGFAPSIVHHEVWIPRDAATVVERGVKRRREVIAPPEQDGPWTIAYLQGAEVAQASGQLVAVESETATIDLEESRMSISTGEVIAVRRQTITFIKKP